ncbi:NVEALA domain-containing protein [Bacteroides sp.]|uniref:NVEALA domain-containing protein n=1 Tax=Bacteroides sp. TaxID=29523 RepID=UPI0026373791|nr:NVEALA domain-containing protein [Bacteroides sp.]MDD3036517.1 NVEALA domain-containing protein [Bacteroides sp.]
MKIKIIGISAVMVIVIVTMINTRLVSNKSNKTNLLLQNVEALAQDEGTQDKKYRYDTFSKIPCTIYVGGAYAKGWKVTCWDGSDHPICVDCTL